MAAIERQKKNIGGKRYLPEEVAVATQGKIPANRGAITKEAKTVRKHLKSHAFKKQSATCIVAQPQTN